MIGILIIRPLKGGGGYSSWVYFFGGLVFRVSDFACGGWVWGLDILVLKISFEG